MASRWQGDSLQDSRRTDGSGRRHWRDPHTLQHRFHLLRYHRRWTAFSDSRGAGAEVRRAADADPELDSSTESRRVEEMSLTAGTKLGAYEILSPIGAGGMGEVYRARDTKLKRDV